MNQRIIIILIFFGLLTFGYYGLFSQSKHTTRKQGGRPLRTFYPEKSLIRAELRNLDSFKNFFRSLPVWKRIENSQFEKLIEQRFLPLMQLQMSSIRANYPIPAEQLLRSIGEKLIIYVPDEQNPKNNSIVLVTKLEFGDGSDKLSNQRFDQLFRSRIVEPVRRRPEFSVQKEDFRGYPVHRFWLHTDWVSGSIPIATVRLKNNMLVKIGNRNIKSEFNRYLSAQNTNEFPFEEYELDQSSQGLKIYYDAEVNTTTIRNIINSFTPKYSPVLLDRFPNFEVAGTSQVKNSLIHTDHYMKTPNGADPSSGKQSKFELHPSYMPVNTLFYAGFHLFHGPKLPSTAQLGIVLDYDRNKKGTLPLGKSSPLDLIFILKYESSKALRNHRINRFVSKIRRGKPKLRPEILDGFLSEKMYYVAETGKRLLISTDQKYLDRIKERTEIQPSIQSHYGYGKLRNNFPNKMAHVSYLSSSPVGRMFEDSRLKNFDPQLRQLIRTFVGFNPYRETSSLLRELPGTMAGGWWDPSCSCYRYKTVSSGDFFVPVWGILNYSLRNSKIMEEIGSKYFDSSISSRF